ncbi:MAG TPA: gephyrin-like molybdotransferase Glp [Solirubrobacteraceae bacterium]|nr:gephyrin-like molybdotransferase Glp [Solirubrobacteraceae bacterium]
MSSGLLSIAEARARIAEAVAPLDVDSVALDDACGRVLGEEIVAEHDVPPFDNSAMDGFAVRAGSGGRLLLVDESRAGRGAAVTLGPEEAIRISTGAPLPAGADAVVPIERASVEGDMVALDAPAEPGANVRRAGEDMPAGTVVVTAGTPLGPAELAAIAAAGRGTVSCGRRPRVAVLVTGDELVPAGARLGEGQIHNTNEPALAALTRAAGAELVLRRHVGDDADQTRAAISAALEVADVIAVSGGVSVGPHDHVKSSLIELGVEQRFWGVALKPGKPTWFGARGRQLAFGLPGNPVSAFVCFALFVRPALRALQGAAFEPRRGIARLDTSVQRSRDREQALRVTLDARADGLFARPTGAQGSHVITSLLGADALAMIAAGDGQAARGDEIEIELL